MPGGGARGQYLEHLLARQIKSIFHKNRAFGDTSMKFCMEAQNTLLFRKISLSSKNSKWRTKWRPFFKMAALKDYISYFAIPNFTVLTVR